MGTKLSINGITFGDATVQNTAATTGVTSLTAGSGISVSAATGAVTVSATGGGTVTSITAGNGLTGGTITSSGTISLDYYTGSTENNTSYPIGSYLFTQSPGSTNQSVPNMRINNTFKYFVNSTANATALAGTWRWRGYNNLDPCNNAQGPALVQRTA